MSRLAVFWSIQAVVFTLFLAEVAFLASIWLRARIPGLPPDASGASKLAYLAREGLRFVLGPGFPAALKGLVMDGMVHRPLLGVSLLRWAGHIMAFGAFLLLGAFSIITGFAVEILYGFLGVVHPLVLVFTRPDHPAIALVNEVLSVILLAGLVVLTWRRFVARAPQLHTAFDDAFVIGLLLAIVASGFLLEAVRLLAKGYIGTAPALGFVGYGLHRLLAGLPVSRHGLYIGLFFLHFGLCDLLLLYLPFSKFAHVLAAPVLVALNAAQSHPRPEATR